MPKQYQQYTIIVLSMSWFAFSLVSLGLIVVDPLQIFHKPWVRDTYFIRELRYQSAGIINHSKFDSIILGTSQAANFSSKEASRLWNSDFVNISPDGSRLSERSYILKYALKHKSLQNVIISLDGFSEYGKDRPDFPAANYSYLYNSSKADDLQVYLTPKFYRYLLCKNIIIESGALCKNTKDLENVAEWYSNPEHNKRFGGLNKWFENRDNGQIKNALASIVKKTQAIKNGDIGFISEQEHEKYLENQKLSFDHYVLHYIAENPNTKFYLYFPPYSRMSQALNKRFEPYKYQLYIDTLRYIVKALSDYPNAKIFGFDHLEFTNNIANYKDPGHYHPRYNSAMLNWMKNDEYDLTSRNVEEYINTMSAFVDRYDIISLGRKIESFLQSAN